MKHFLLKDVDIRHPERIGMVVYEEGGVTYRHGDYIKFKYISSFGEVFIYEGYVFYSKKFSFYKEITFILKNFKYGNSKEDCHSLEKQWVIDHIPFPLREPKIFKDPKYQELFT